MKGVKGSYCSASIPISEDNGKDICGGTDWRLNRGCGHRRDQHSSFWDYAKPDYCTVKMNGMHCGCEKFIEIKE